MDFIKKIGLTFEALADLGSEAFILRVIIIGFFLWGDIGFVLSAIDAADKHVIHLVNWIFAVLFILLSLVYFVYDHRANKKG